MHNDPENIHFELAQKFVSQTDRNIFITGRAGTGKTTFLKSIKEKGLKKMAVVAPTGVAAINAGGVTIHSLFQLAPGTFVPGNYQGWLNADFRVFNKDSLLKSIRYNKAKRDLLKELELLVIDEVSMVKADTIDAVDTILRWIRSAPHQAFGGVQVLFIGDLFQLPPVMPDDEWEILKSYYQSPFFFDAQVIQKNQPICIELQKIYRQKDDEFIILLNAVRNNITSKNQLDFLNRFYQPLFKADDGETYITLTTHNAKADVINQRALQELKNTARYFHAAITGEFPPRSFPVDEILCLKEGAQIMFTKNDKGEARRYYNGKIGTVIRIDDEEKIFIRFEGEADEFELETETWLNIRYQLNKEKNIIEEEELGSFTQYPVRLAWAITIHKSQGLTFEKAIIDAGESFSPGQVYVALSRLTSLDKLVLHSRIHPGSISTDVRVIRFSEQKSDEEILYDQLTKGQNLYVRKNLINSFSMLKLYEDTVDIHKEMADRGLIDEDEIFKWTGTLIKLLDEKKEVSEKFMLQLDRVMAPEGELDIALIKNRISAAKDWFSLFLTTFRNEVEENVKKFSSNKIAKKHIPSFKHLLISVSIKEKQIQQSLNIVDAMINGKQREEILEISGQRIVPDNISGFGYSSTLKEKNTGDKTHSGSISLRMYREGKPVNEIAAERNLAISTIEGHLVAFIETGEIKLEELVAEEKIPFITEAMNKIEGNSMKSVKEILGDEYSYAEIRAVYTHMKSMLSQENLPMDSKV